MTAYQLTADCETIHEQDGLTIYWDRHNVERAVYCCGEDGRPLPLCDPEVLGFGLIQVDAVLGDVAVAEVTDLRTLLAGHCLSLP